MDLFAPAVNDQSIEYLYKIFGSMGGVIAPPSAGGGTSISLTLLGTMFKTFNSVVLAVGALIVVYMTVVGVMKTAHEGQFMGRNWNSLWLPIRTVIGIAALVPTPSGYSGIQIVMMWVIIQGIGAADTLWTTVLEYISLTGSPYGEVSVVSIEAKNSVKNLFVGVLCAKSAATTYPNPYKSGKKNAYYCNYNSRSTYCRSINSNTFSPTLSNGTSIRFGPSGACGTLEYCNVQQACSGGGDSLACDACRAQHTALETIIPTMAAIAQKYIDVDYQYQQYYQATKDSTGNSNVTPPPFVRNYCSANGIQNCTGAGLDGLSPYKPKKKWDGAPNNVIRDIYWEYGMKPDLDGNNFVMSSTLYYLKEVGDVVSGYMEQLAQPGDTITGQLAAARDKGWIFAGSYYHVLARMNKNNLDASNPPLKFSVPKESPPTGGDLYNYRNNFLAANALMSLASGGNVTDDALGESFGPSQDAANDTGQALTTLTSPDSYANPINQLSIAGYTMLMVATITFIIMLILLVVTGVLSNFSAFILGTGIDNPAKGAHLSLVLFLGPVVLGFLGLLVTVGATLAIYVPLIPYIIFTMGAINWFILTIEAMVAGPLVALGILSPSGQHDLLGAADKGMWLLFGIFLRPSMMIFGLMSAMLLASVVVAMINAGFGTVVATMFDFGNNTGEASAGGGVAAAFNPLALIFILVAYVSLITTALNKCFSLISYIPDNVLGWLGQQGRQMGGDAEFMKQAMGQAGQQASGQMTGAITKGAQHMDASKNKQKAAADHKATLAAMKKK